ncbi:MAG: bifunctional hydroxymethylpyrimidine kinase/phosphomethylpyrimidine kinase [Deltaproteobacteria bacterium]|nr:MAG: bifunctional hydroxymethylpyrimidine kinase/phosphomethylpyrimidine kinase [Deltaproteobacteria bacterium]
MSPLSQRRLERIVDAFSRVKLLVVGDVMLDEYLWGDVERVSQEAPVPVVHVRRESIALGGAGNVVRNVVGLGGRCACAATVGEDSAGRLIGDLLKDHGVEASGIVRVPGRPTTRKTRVEARSQQIVRFDRETTGPLPRAAARRLLASVEATLPSMDGVILEDYGKGVLERSIARGVISRCRAVAVPVYVDPKEELRAFRGATLIKPNLREAEALTGIVARSPDGLARAIQRLRRATGGADVVVTRGAAGMTVAEGDAELRDVPTAAPEVFDIQGCGDTSIAALALARCCGASLLEAAVIANAAAGVVARKVGTAIATPAEVCAALGSVVAAVRAGPRSAS